MNIVVFGAGAIGSLLGALLSKHHRVFLIGRKPHVDVIHSRGLKVIGRTPFQGKIAASYKVKDVPFNVDLLILSVKSFDTLRAIKQAQSCISEDTIVLTFQNGLDNIEKIQSIVPKVRILAGVTTHGSVFIEPGVIHHTGFGRTVIGELDGSKTNRLKSIVGIFNEAGIPTYISYNIYKEIWQKVVINSAINPLTAIFQCKNGYLLENPILSHLVLRLCEESTNVANSINNQFTQKNIFIKTSQVIAETAENYSSMLQSIFRASRTEIDTINGKIVFHGKNNNVSVLLNELVCHIITQLY